MKPRTLPTLRRSASALACGLLVLACRGGEPESVAAVEGAGTPSEGRVLRVGAGGDLQRALDRARPGDVITLAAGAVFTGPFTLPAKSGDDWITIRGDAEAALPPAGTRVDRSQAGLMPKLEAASGAVVSTEPAAHHFRFVGIEIRPAEGAFLYGLVVLGRDDTSFDQLPHHIAFERCYLHGDPRRGTRRGIALNSRDTTIVDSYFSDFKEVSADSQAIAGWNGPGPFRIENNHLEGAGENVLFGGADPSIPGLVPSDIVFRRNLVTKPLAWKVGEPGFEGTPWAVKNLFELKNARRVVVEGNVFEQNWVHAQNGFAILFTVRNQDGRAPWSTVEDVTFASNVVRHTASGVNILGRDDQHPSGPTRNVVIRNNLFEDVGGRWGGGGVLFQMLDGIAGVVIEHNTAFQAGNLVTAEGRPHPGFVFRDNIAHHNENGIVGTATAPGESTLAAFFPGSVFRRNVIVGPRAAPLPSDNFSPPRLEDVGFVDMRAGDYRLAPGSRYRGAATDGKDVGVDFEAFAKARAASGPGGASAPAGGPARRPRLSLPALAFWLSAALLGYTHLGYPALMLAWAALRSRPPRRADIQPGLSLVIVAHDEAERLKRRLENALALDYPRERLEIVLASDGSTDETVARARAFEHQGVRVVAFATRRGKPSVLNEVVPTCRGEIVVLADARQSFERDALRALARAFADPEVGAVSGELLLVDEATGFGQGVGAYWRYEKMIRSAESRVRSTVGATGAIYAIRRALFEPLPSETLLDDVVIPLRIALKGYRVLFEPEARAYDRAPASAAEEFARKVRTIAGNFQLFAREPRLLAPWSNPLWLQSVSHKALRLLTPLLLAAALFANLALVAGGPVYRLLLLAQAAFYGAALLGVCLRRRTRQTLLVSVPYAFCVLAWATVIAGARYLTGHQPVTWAHPAAGRPAHGA